MTVSAYSNLKQQIVLSVGASAKHGQIVQALKEFYKYDIDSPRRYQQIKTIGHLLKILEIRDVLSEDDVGSLKEIARKLNSEHSLLKKINKYEAARIKGEHGNYCEPKQQNSSHKEDIVSSSSNNSTRLVSEKKKEIITDAVVDDIGCYWRDLGRNLGIKEYIIDEIDSNDCNSANKASMMMEIFYENVKARDPQRWFVILCDALEQTRRKDISKLLQNIMTVNN